MIVIKLPFFDIDKCRLREALKQKRILTQILNKMVPVAFVRIRKAEKFVDQLVLDNRNDFRIHVKYEIILRSFCYDSLTVWDLKYYKETKRDKELLEWLEKISNDLRVSVSISCSLKEHEKCGCTLLCTSSLERGHNAQYDAKTVEAMYSGFYFTNLRIDRQEVTTASWMPKRTLMIQEFIPRLQNHFPNVTIHGYNTTNICEFVDMLNYDHLILSMIEAPIAYDNFLLCAPLKKTKDITITYMTAFRGAKVLEAQASSLKMEYQDAIFLEFCPSFESLAPIYRSICLDKWGTDDEWKSVVKLMRQFLQYWKDGRCVEKLRKVKIKILQGKSSYKDIIDGLDIVIFPQPCKFIEYDIPNHKVITRFSKPYFNLAMIPRNEYRGILIISCLPGKCIIRIVNTYEELFDALYRAYDGIPIDIGKLFADKMYIIEECLEE